MFVLSLTRMRWTPVTPENSPIPAHLAQQSRIGPVAAAAMSEGLGVTRAASCRCWWRLSCCWRPVAGRAAEPRRGTSPGGGRAPALPPVAESEPHEQRRLASTGRAPGRAVVLGRDRGGGAQRQDVDEVDVGLE